VFGVIVGSDAVLRKFKRFLRVITRVAFFAIIVFALYVFIVTDVLKKDYINVFGYSYFIVETGSMKDTINVNDIVIDKLGNRVAVGDIVTYRNGDYFITHRVVAIDGDTIVTKGDANNTSDSSINREDIIGIVKFYFPLMTLLKIVIFIVILFIIFSIVSIEETDENVKRGKVTPVLNRIFGDGDLTRRERNFVSSVIKVLSVDQKEKVGFDKDTKNKIKYIYRLTLVLLSGNVKELNYTLDTPGFKELYDYDFDKIGFTSKIRDELYMMPVTAYLEIMLYCCLYNKKEFYDAVYKVLKYKVKVDKSYTALKEYDQETMVKVNSATEKFAKTIKVDLKDVTDYVDAKNYLNDL